MMNSDNATRPKRQKDVTVDLTGTVEQKGQYQSTLRVSGVREGDGRRVQASTANNSTLRLFEDVSLGDIPFGPGKGGRAGGGLGRGGGKSTVSSSSTASTASTASRSVSLNESQKRPRTALSCAPAAHNQETRAEPPLGGRGIEAEAGRPPKAVKFTESVRNKTARDSLPGWM